MPGSRKRKGFTKLLEVICRDFKENKTERSYKCIPWASLILYTILICVSIYLYSIDSLRAAATKPGDLRNESNRAGFDSLRFSVRHLLSLEDSNTTSNSSDETTTSSSAKETTHASEGLPWEGCEFENSSICPPCWVVHHLWWIFFFFIGLAVVCDDFFVPALEVVSEKLKLSEDVAGATFMAAGSSAPELFTSLMGVAQETDVGVGAIVGSAVFNILVIISLTGALAGQVLQLDWRPLVRDIVFYAASILVFLGVAYDGLIMWYEALLLLLLYVLYIIAMVFNPKLMVLMGKCRGPAVVVADTENVDSVAAGNRSNSLHMDESPLPVHLYARRVSFQKSSFSGGHARRISLHHHLHALRPDSNLGNISEMQVQTSPQAHLSTRRDSGFSDSSKECRDSKRRPSNSVQVTSPEPVTSPTTAQEEEVTTDLPNGDVDNRILEPTRKIENEVDNNTQPNGAMVTKTGQSNGPPIATEEEDPEEEDDEIVICKASCCPRIKSTPPTMDDESTKCSYISFGLKWVLYIIAFPYYFMCTFTIPDCSKEHNKKWYLLTFLLSIIWILGLSFAMVTMVTRTGCIIGVDEFVMGLVIVAIGTSVPDCLSSILVARDGFGDMAVSNAIGSNVFDIDLGLGFPFLLSILIQAGSPLSLLDESEQKLQAAGYFPIIPHVKFAFILLGLLAVIFILFFASKFRLNRLISVSFIVLYILFIAYALVQQLVCKKYQC